MKVYVFGSIIPIPGLKRENDIILRTYKEISKRFDIKYRFSKSLNYSNKLLSPLHPKFKNFYRLSVQKKYVEPLYNTEVLFYKWISFKNSIKLKAFLAPINYFLFGKKLLRDVKVFNPDIIHANNLYADGYMAYRISKALSIPYIFTLRVPPDYNIMKDRYTRRILENAELLICHNYEVFEQYKEHFRAIRIPHGINDLFFVQKRRFFNSGDPFKIITISRLLDWKNVDVVVKVVNGLIDKGYNIEYTIIGEGPELEKIEKIIKEKRREGQIKIKPWMAQDKVLDEMLNNHLFILMSYPETLGRIFFESIASSTPMLGTYKSGSYGLLSEEHGAHYTELDETKIMNKLEWIMGNYESVSSSAFKGGEYLKQYNWDEISGLYMDLFQANKK